MVHEYISYDEILEFVVIFICIAEPSLALSPSRQNSKQAAHIQGQSQNTAVLLNLPLENIHFAAKQ